MVQVIDLIVDEDPTAAKRPRVIEVDLVSDDQERPSRDNKDSGDDGNSRNNHSNSDHNTHLPLHVRRSLARLACKFENRNRDALLQQIREFCQQSPDERSIDNIVGAVSARLREADSSVSSRAWTALVSPVEYYPKSSSSASVEHDQIKEVELIAPPRQKGVSDVLQIFPTAKVSFVESLLARCNGSFEQAIMVMADKGYEKEANPPKPPHSEEETYDFSSSSWQTTESYRQEALQLLKRNFPFLRAPGVSKIFADHHHHYYLALKALEDACGAEAERTGEAIDIGNEWTKTRLQQLQERLGAKHSFLLVQRPKRSIASSWTTPADSVLKKEQAWIEQKKLEKKRQREEEEREQLLDKMALETGEVMECGCCYEQAPIVRMVQCSEGHLFCRNCLRHYAEQTVFGNGSVHLKCLSSTETCAGVFSDAMLRRALPEKEWQKYSEALTRDALKAANIADLVQCYACDLAVQMPGDAGSILHCLVCGQDTCRHCGGAAHIPLRCNEVEKKKDVHSRTSVEEALTKVRVRECPKCKTRFFKTEGCNKMKCTCGALLCYICRKDITRIGYAHFCQRPHCDHKTCNQCRLFTDFAEDDRQAMYEAGLKTLEQLNDTGSSGPVVAETDLRSKQVELLGKLLEGGLPRTARKMGSAEGGRPPPVQAVGNVMEIRAGRDIRLNNVADAHPIHYRRPRLRARRH